MDTLDKQGDLYNTVDLSFMLARRHVAFADDARNLLGNYEFGSKTWKLYLAEFRTHLARAAELIGYGSTHLMALHRAVKADPGAGSRAALIVELLDELNILCDRYNDLNHVLRDYDRANGTEHL